MVVYFGNNYLCCSTLLCYVTNHFRVLTNVLSDLAKMACCNLDAATQAGHTYALVSFSLLQTAFWQNNFALKNGIKVVPC